jgi:hypothetical protein
VKNVGSATKVLSSRLRGGIGIHKGGKRLTHREFRAARVFSLFSSFSFFIFREAKSRVIARHRLFLCTVSRILTLRQFAKYFRNSARVSPLRIPRGFIRDTQFSPRLRYGIDNTSRRIIEEGEGGGIRERTTLFKGKLLNINCYFQGKKTNGKIASCCQFNRN